MKNDACRFLPAVANQLLRGLFVALALMVSHVAIAQTYTYTGLNFTTFTGSCSSGNLTASLTFGPSVTANFTGSTSDVRSIAVTTPIAILTWPSAQTSLSGNGSGNTPSFQLVNGNIIEWDYQITSTAGNYFYIASNGASPGTPKQEDFALNQIFEKGTSSCSTGVLTSSGTWTSPAPSPPIAQNQSVATTQNAALPIDLTIGASGAPTSAALVTQPAHGTLTGFPATSVTYTPAAGYTGQDSFQFTLSNAGGSSPAATVTVAVNSIPTPEIMLAGSSAPLTGTQMAVMGEPTTLEASISDYAQQWTITTPASNGTSLDALSAGYVIGGYTVSTGCPAEAGATSAPNCTGNVTQLTYQNFTTQTTPTFYWVAPGTYTVTYTYMQADNASASSSVTFTVAGPTAPTVTIKEGTLKVSADSKGIKYLTIAGIGKIQNCAGKKSCTPGITFTPGATVPANVTGNFSWIQLITSNSIFYNFPDSVYHCAPGGPNGNAAPGLDNTYPYGATAQPEGAPTPIALDQPSIPITGNGPIDLDGLKKAAWAFEAQIYLMWQATGVTGAIPVPLGNIYWSVAGNAVYNAKDHWAAKAPNVPFPIFIPSATYPTWQTVVLGSVNTCASQTMH